VWALGGISSTMDSFRLTVVPQGTRFVAKSTTPPLTALGSSPEKATETLRLMALAQLGSGQRPEMLIARINQPGLCTIVMQPIEKSFTAANLEEVGWRYMASVAGPTREVVE
jgi:hypothetical protein